MTKPISAIYNHDSHPRIFNIRVIDHTLAHVQLCFLMDELGVHSVRDLILQAIGELYARERDKRLRKLT